MHDSATDMLGLQAQMRRYQEDGIRQVFTAGPAGVLRCGACHTLHEGHEVPVDAIHRGRAVQGPADDHVPRAELAAMERRDDPSTDRGRDAALVVARCPSCGVQGSLLVPQGPAATRDEALLLAALAGPRA